MITPLYGTENVNGEPTVTFEQRLGRCYSLAGYALALGSAPEDALLVHGTIRRDDVGVPVTHAWLMLSDGDVWEPAQHRIWNSPAWLAFFNPSMHRWYTRSELRALISTHGTWGPWSDEDEEAT